MKLLFIGDVVGSLGRTGARGLLPAAARAPRARLVVVNGENVAGGLGITPKTADELLRLGVDVITLGNHAYRHRDVYALPRRASRGSCGRPTTCERNPGRGHTVVEKDGVRLGRREPVAATSSCRRARSPFPEVDACSTSSTADADHVLVDFHAEATSEKVAMGWHLDGRVTAVRRHAHARPDRRRARAAGRHRLHLRRRHDRPARRRDRRAHASRRSSRSSRRCPCASRPPRRPVAQRRARSRGGADGLRRRSSSCS